MLLAKYDEACRLLPQNLLMIQELVPGGGECQFSYAVVCKEGKPLATLTARRTRQYPMDFGRASTFVETVKEDGIAEPAERFLEAIRYTGIAELEFKKDPRTGEFKLLDINPRVWGWYSLCDEAGVNLAHLLWLVFQGEPLPQVRAHTGVRWFRMSTDVLAVAGEITAGRMGVGEYLRSLRGPRASAIHAKDDLVPGLMEIPLLSRLAGQRLLRKIGR